MTIRRSLAWRFAALAIVAAWVAAPAHAAPPGAYTTKGAWSFVSAPALHPPKLRALIRTVSAKLAPGNLLLGDFPNVNTPGPMTGQSGPLMIDNKLQPVWFAPVATSEVATNLQQEVYNGQPVLVYWRGVVGSGGVTLRGQVVVVDQHYHTVATLKAKPPWVVSLHDAAIDGKTIWVTVYRNVRNQNLKRYHGPARGTVLDAGVQQYDLKTGKLLFTWDALNPGHRPNISLADSRQPAPPSGSSTAWDAYHVNSVQPLATGQILVSLRNTWAAYLLDPKTGRTVWTLGGRHSSFKGSANTRFSWQHDVRMLPNGEVTLFNDNCCGVLSNSNFQKANGPSAGMVLRLNVTAHTVSLVKAFLHHPPFSVAFLGSMQLLGDGNAVIGYGSLPFFSEFDPSGRLLLDVKWPGKDLSYRVGFTSTWVGMPTSPPAGAARRGKGRTTVYASWNGATQVASWKLMAGPSTARLAPVATKRRSGFETSLTVAGSSDKVFQLIALDAQGHSLGTSARFSAR